MEFSRDGHLLASTGADGSVLLWDVAHRRQLATLPYKSRVNDVTFSPDGKRMASATEDGMVMLWETARRELIATFEGHSLAVYAVAFGGPNGGVLPSASVDGTAILWDVEHRQRLATLAGHPRHRLVGRLQLRR